MVFAVESETKMLPSPPIATPAGVINVAAKPSSAPHRPPASVTTAPVARLTRRTAEFPWSATTTPPAASTAHATGCAKAAARAAPSSRPLTPEPASVVTTAVSRLTRRRTLLAESATTAFRLAASQHTPCGKEKRALDPTAST